ncbi:MAG TPA: UDP-N-acetylmuramoyl-L-alanyl-D-glutamate--2,6-diaminopimelate ligase [Thermoflexales bacterium]|nr:UDP-N-acetylmuramoyl-L-alanyl-D-glutamate--2,6-diaminopimelate ligase [Thermoflexales bacterium]
MKSLSHLLSALPTPTSAPKDTDVAGVTRDSRRVQPGWLFVAYKGVEADGHKYLADAARRGAAAIVCEAAPAQPLDIPVIVVPNGREAFAHLCAAWNDFPSRSLTVIGVTGTDGKTTTTNLIFNILKNAGIRAGMISTVNAVIGDKTLDTGLHTTTPDSDDVQNYLAEMRDAGLTHCILEVTSHGLAQYRVDGTKFDVAVVTNITHEHLDLHGSREAYRAAKARLFEMAPVHVLNADDAYSFEHLKNFAAKQRFVYAIDKTEDGGRKTEDDNSSVFRPPSDNIVATDIQHLANALHFTALTPRGEMSITSALIGDYNVSNILAAIGAALALDVPSDAIARGIASLAGVPGRMERIAAGQPFTAIVDFAHTPNALANALTAARGITAGRLIAVFGCAGERDRQKRPMMAQVAARLADIAIFTAEDPRRESLDDIFAQMDAGVAALPDREKRAEILHVKDRGEAIARAVSIAQTGDTVIACGKGHEQSMCFGTTEYPWDDRAAMRESITNDKLRIKN